MRPGLLFRGQPACVPVPWAAGYRPYQRVVSRNPMPCSGALSVSHRLASSENVNAPVSAGRASRQPSRYLRSVSEYPKPA